MKKIIVWIAFIICISINLPTAFANSSSLSKEIQTKIKMIDTKYGIKITIDKKLEASPDIYNNALDDIIEEYARFPNGLISEITSYYKSKKITTVIHLRPFREKDNAMFHGTFDIAKNKAFIEYRVIEGIEREIVAHEMGHLIHSYLEAVNNANQIRKTWIAYNGKIQYRNNWVGWDTSLEQVFARNYGTHSYGEDFATII